MRKYYKPGNVAKRNPTKDLPSRVGPWLILRLYAESAAGDLGWDLLCDIISICYAEDISRYLILVSKLDLETQSLSESASAQFVLARRQVCGLLKKYPFVRSSLPWDPRISAVEKWHACESHCKETNIRLANQVNSEVPSWVQGAKALIANVLGDLTSDLVMKICKSGHHGPGSTLSSQGNRVTPYYKYGDLPYTSSGAARFYAYATISADIHWTDLLESSGRRKELPPIGSSRVQKELMLFKDCVMVRDSEKITFVPKDSRTDRPIAVGASMNLFLQLGVKSYMEERLKRVNVDLTDQNRNRNFAKIGSSLKHAHDNGNQYSTLDLASASDTISIELVRLLLDPLWFAFLDDLRHKSGVLDGVTYEYSKFSAMGNGFTFPLESLLFWAITKSSIEANQRPCRHDDIAVYGDDIIVRYRDAATVISALQWAGFQVNDEKSFISGYFKESCGADYFQEHDVRPLYLKREIKTYADIYYCCNWMAKKLLSCPFASLYNRFYTSLLEKTDARERSFGPITAPVINPTRRFTADIAEDLLEVPLDYISKLGARPWLSETEKRSLILSKHLSKADSSLQCLYAIRTFTKTIRFAAFGKINFLLWLSSSDEVAIPRDYIKDRQLKDEGMGRYTSRRNAVEYVIKVTPILSWDGHYHRHELYRHPINKLII